MIGRHRRTAYPTLADEARDVLVVFSDHTEIRWLRFLKRGYRHCFAVFRTNGCWVVYNPLSNRTDVIVRRLSDPFPDVDAVVAVYHQEGNRVVHTHCRQAPWRCPPIALYTCVEAVKRLLGIHNRWILTPWQLRNYLEKNADKNNER